MSAPDHCAIAVAQAAPARPQSSPNMNNGSRMRFTSEMDPVTHSGVLVS